MIEIITFTAALQLGKPTVGRSLQVAQLAQNVVLSVFDRALVVIGGLPNGGDSLVVLALQRGKVGRALHVADSSVALAVAAEESAVAEDQGKQDDKHPCPRSAEAVAVPAAHESADIGEGNIVVHGVWSPL